MERRAGGKRGGRWGRREGERAGGREKGGGHGDEGDARSQRCEVTQGRRREDQVV